MVNRLRIQTYRHLLANVFLQRFNNNNVCIVFIFHFRVVLMRLPKQHKCHVCERNCIGARGTI